MMTNVSAITRSSSATSTMGLVAISDIRSFSSFLSYVSCRPRVPGLRPKKGIPLEPGKPPGLN
jgi:hypothetical protein